MNLFIAILLLGVMCLNPYESYPTNEGNIKLVSEYHEYAVGTTTISFVLVNNSDKKFLYCEPVTILKKVGSEHIPYIEMSGTDVAVLLMPRSKNIETIQIGEGYGTLSDGSYAVKIILHAFPDPESHPTQTVLGKFNIVYGY